MSITIEIANQSSTQLLNALNGLVPQLSSSAAPLTIAQLDAIIENDSTSLIVATNGIEVVGTLTLLVVAIPTGTRAIIEDVIVDHSVRGAGVGQQLVEFALRLAHDRGAKTVDLTSRPSREVANALYEKIGFTRRETNVYRYSLKN